MTPTYNMTHSFAHTIKNLQHLQAARLLLWMECALLAIACAAYMYFIATSVVQVVLRQELLVEIQEAETRVSGYEATYFARLDALRPETAEKYGLVAISPSAYVTVDSGERLTRRP